MRKYDKKKGGRPSKPTDEVRKKSVTVKLTDAEYRDVKSRAKSAGVTMAEYIRHGAFRLTIVSRLNGLEMKIAQGILRLHSDFNQAIKIINSLKRPALLKNLIEVIANMHELSLKLRPNKVTDYVCKNP